MTRPSGPSRPSRRRPPASLVEIEEHPRRLEVRRSPPRARPPGAGARRGACRILLTSERVSASTPSRAAPSRARARRSARSTSSARIASTRSRRWRIVGTARSAANQPSKRCCCSSTIASACATLAAALVRRCDRRSPRDRRGRRDRRRRAGRARGRRCAARRCRSRTSGGSSRPASAARRPGAREQRRIARDRGEHHVGLGEQARQLVEPVRGRAEARPRAARRARRVRFATATDASPRSRSARSARLRSSRPRRPAARACRRDPRRSARRGRPPRAPPRPAAPRSASRVRTRLAVANACWKRRPRIGPARAALDRRAIGVLGLAEDLRLADHHRVERGGHAQHVAHGVAALCS